MAYEILKFLHVLGVVLLVGNVTITAFWKVFADRTDDARIVGYAQHLVTLCDWVFTLGGIALIIVGGYGMAAINHLHIFEERWLILGQILFLVSGLIWVVLLIPYQIRQGRQARDFHKNGTIPLSYWRDARLWLIWGIIATVPLVAAIYVMVTKP